MLFRKPKQGKHFHSDQYFSSIQNLTTYQIPEVAPLGVLCKSTAPKATRQYTTTATSKHFLSNCALFIHHGVNDIQQHQCFPQSGLTVSLWFIAFKVIECENKTPHKHVRVHHIVLYQLQELVKLEQGNKYHKCKVNYFSSFSTG